MSDNVDTDKSNLTKSEVNTDMACYVSVATDFLSSETEPPNDRTVSGLPARRTTTPNGTFAGIHSQSKPIKLDSIDIKPVSHLFTRYKGKVHKKPRVVLFDTGARFSCCRADSSQLGTVRKGQATIFATPNGTMSTTKKTDISFSLGDFSDSKVIDWSFHVLPEAQKLPYDFIIGRDLMQALKMDVLYSENKLVWEGVSIPMQDVKGNNWQDLNIFGDDPEIVQAQSKRLQEILENKYEAADLEKEVEAMSHLTKFQKVALLAVLKNHETLFDGELGEWKGPPVDIPLKPGATPYHARAYPIPVIHLKPFKQDLDRLVEAKVLTKVNRSEWAAPSFIIPKKDGRVRFISDFRRLNTMIKRAPYPLPHIQDMLYKLSNFSYATTLDLCMGYYHITLTDAAKKICTITTPFGKYEYNRLPMGCCIAPDIFQERMSTLMDDLETVRTYLDDLLIVSSGTFEDHLAEVTEVMKRLQKAGLKCKIEKCKFAVPEVEYLGYIITREGIKPDPKKIAAILNLERPQDKKQVRQFLGMVQYYRDLWPKRSEILVPITELTKGNKNGPIKWTARCDDAFRNMKALIAKDVLLAYPDFTRKFTIYTDASDHQLGAVIMQNTRPLAFYSRKLTKAQLNYTTTEKELLSIVETLKEFRNILLGHEIEVFTDHNNLTFETIESASQRVQRWKSLIQEFGVTLQYIKGEANVVADAISRLPITGHDEPPSPKTLEEDTCDLLCVDALFITPCADCFSLDPEEIAFPLAPQIVEAEQKLELQKKSSKQMNLELARKSSEWKYTMVEGINLVHYRDRVYVPKTLRTRVLEWYHLYLQHPGGDRLASTLTTVCRWPGIVDQARKFCKRCSVCQKFKTRKAKYGHLPSKEAEIPEPWHTVCVDLIGTYTISANVRQLDNAIKKMDLNLLCMTFIDPATGWFEIAEVPLIDQSSARISQLFNDVWLCRYPRPRKVIFDNGSEFKKDFIPLLKDFAVKPTCTSIKNPQANAILERIHQVVGSMLKTNNLQEVIFDAVTPWNSILASIAYAVRCSFHSTLQATPGQLVFGRDMLLNITFEPDWEVMWKRKQKLINYNNKRENAKRVPHDYQVGDHVYILRDGHYRKLEGDKLGPYQITQVFANGTVRIQRGLINERINIRRLTPHFGAPPE